MFKRQDKNAVRRIRHSRVRRKVSGTSERPRLSVYRSLNHMYAQLIDDEKGVTLVSASTLEASLKPTLSDGDKKDIAKKVGIAIAKKAIEAGYKNVIFDRGG